MGIRNRDCPPGRSSAPVPEDIKAINTKPMVKAKVLQAHDIMQQAREVAVAFGVLELASTRKILGSLDERLVMHIEMCLVCGELQVL